MATPALKLDFYNVHEATKNVESQLSGELTDLAAPATNAHIESDLAHMVLMLSEDLAKALRSLTLHSAEYVERLLDEVRVCDLAAAVEQDYADQPLLRVMMMLVQLQLLWGVARACEA